jgi:hypothetical protein
MTDEERAKDLGRIKQFAAARGLPETWALKIYAAKHGLI